MAKRSANTQVNAAPPGWGLPAGAALAGLSLAAVVWSLWGMTLDRSGEADAAAHNARMLWPYWIASGSCWLGLTIIWLVLRRRVVKWSAAASMLVLTVAVVARIAVLVTNEPALSDDVYRYIFDGRNVANGINPYLTDPADRVAALSGGASPHWRGEGELLPLLAYPEVTSPYLPVSQHVFALLGAFCEQGDWTSPAASARVFRVGFTLFELALMCALLATLRRAGHSAWWLALYAWHPLAIDGFAASGHQDIIGIALMIAAMATIGVVRDPNSPRSESTGVLATCAAAILLALSVMVKPIAALAGLMWLRRQPLPVWFLSLGVGAITCVALAAPLRWYPHQPAYQAWKQTADWMAEKGAHFGGVYEPVLCIVRHLMPDGPERVPGFNLEQEWLARKICMWMLAGTLLAIFLLARDAWRATAAAMLALTLFSTMCHPWYLLWGLALFPLANRSWGLWIYSLTIAFGYAVFLTGKGHAFGVEWTVSPAAMAIAYIPVAIGVCVDVVAAVRRACAKPQAAETPHETD